MGRLLSRGLTAQERLRQARQNERVVFQHLVADRGEDALHFGARIGMAL